MRLYDFIPISTDHDHRYIVMKQHKTYLVDFVGGTYLQTGENEDPEDLIAAEKFGAFDRTYYFSQDAMQVIGEIMDADWIEVP